MSDVYRAAVEIRGAILAASAFVDARQRELQDQALPALERIAAALERLADQQHAFYTTETTADYCGVMGALAAQRQEDEIDRGAARHLDAAMHYAARDVEGADPNNSHRDG